MAALSNHFALSAALGVATVLSKPFFVFAFPAFVVYVLARLFHSSSSTFTKLFSLIKIAIAVFITAGVIFYPFRDSLDEMRQRVLDPRRMRLESPAPNILYMLQLVIRNVRGVNVLTPEGRYLWYISNGLLLLGSLPSLIQLARAPSPSRFLVAVASGFLSWYIFYTTVH